MAAEKHLLHTPDGVQDLYGREFARMQTVQKKLGRRLALYGYEPIQTPSFEFFDVFSKEVGTTPSRDLYKFFDQENNTLVLRPDFTPSIARCAAKYFMESEDALRFRYEGNVFSHNSSLQGKLNECTQMGVELIGDSSAEADAEMIAMAVEALRDTGLEEFRISIGNVEYFKGLCEKAGLDHETELELREYVSGKNTLAAQELLHNARIEKQYRERLLHIADFFGDHLSLAELKRPEDGERAAGAIERLQEVYHLLELYGVSDYVSFDLGMLSKYNYYTGVIFRAYTYGVGRPVMKGGRYDSLLEQFGKKAASIGFVFLIDEIMEALLRQKAEIELPAEPRVCTYTDEDSYEKALLEAQKLRDSGTSAVLKKA